MMNEREKNMVEITQKAAAEMLLQHDSILVLMHKSPDGDTIGCGYALCLALRACGKQAQPVCSDEVPAQYSYFTDSVPTQNFTPQFIVSVDVADTQLLGDTLSVYRDKIDLCIDHHGSNKRFARYGIIEAAAPACAQMLTGIIREMGVPIQGAMADALFTGLTTDTGCFRYASVTAETYRTAAYLVEQGAQNGTINRLMFETKSKAKVELEKLAMASLQYFCDEQIALICITTEMMQAAGAVDNDTESIPSLPRQIEGVKVAVTVKQKGEQDFRISLRTTEEVDASQICAQLGGGGHKAAAGCSYHGTLEETIEKMVALSVKALESSV